jgi:hypothetical protein
MYLFLTMITFAGMVDAVYWFVIILNRPAPLMVTITQGETS